MKREKKQQLAADAALVAVALAWGVTFTVVKEALASVGPFYFLAIRFALAAAVLFLLYCRRLVRAGLKAVGAGALIGVFLFAGYAFQTVGLLTTTASQAAFITGLFVVLVPLFSAPVERRWPAPAPWLGAVVAALGLALLTGGMRLALHRGEVLVFFCAVSFAMHIVAVGRLARQYDPAVLAIVQIATVAVLSAGCALVWENPPQELTRPVLTALALTALPATALAFLVQNSVQRYTSATHTGVIFTMEPVFAAAYAYLWGGEVLTRLQWLGSGLILAGMLTAELGDGSEAARQPTGEVEPALE